MHVFKRLLYIEALIMERNGKIEKKCKDKIVSMFSHLGVVVVAAADEIIVWCDRKMKKINEKEEK